MSENLCHSIAEPGSLEWSLEFHFVKHKLDVYTTGASTAEFRMKLNSLNIFLFRFYRFWLQKRAIVIDSETLA